MTLINIFLNLRRPNSLSFIVVSVLIVSILLPVSPLSVVTLLLFLTVIILISLVFTRDRLYHHLTLFSYLFFTLIALLIFHAQLITLPEYGGLSGPEGGIGTDDTFFYTQATGDFHASRNGALRASWSSTHTYSKILSIVNWIISLYKETHLVDLLLFNAFGLSFIPTLCFTIARKIDLFKGHDSINPHNQFNIYWLTLFYPAFWIDGLILIRDGWSATLFVAGILALISWQPTTFIITLIALAYIRIASGVTFLVSMAPLFLNHILHKKKLKNILAIFLFIAFLIITMGIWKNELMNYLEVKDISFLRNDYVEGFIGKAAEKKGSVSFLYLISKMPDLIRIPVSFIFFLFAPYFTLTFIKYDTLIPRSVLGLTVVTVNFLFIKYWIQSLLCSCKISKFISMNTISYMHLAYIIGMFILSTMSLQLRHKTMLLPLFCILVAHGMTVSKIKYHRFGSICMTMLIIINVLNIAIRFK